MMNRTFFFYFVISTDPTTLVDQSVCFVSPVKGNNNHALLLIFLYHLN